MNIYLKNIAAISSMLIITYVSLGQNLPNKQKESLWAPANIKINGKADEWKDQFEAYNKATRLFYTMSKDEKNLYFTVKITDMVTIEKILAGGITFIIEPSKKNKDQSPVVITSAVMRLKYYGYIAQILMDTSKNIIVALPKMNMTLDTCLKEIDVSGIANIADPKISLYNEYGILSAGRFDRERSYIYEIAIPLKYLGTDILSADHFNYTIRLNGEKNAGTSLTINGVRYDGASPEAMARTLKNASAGVQPAINTLEKMTVTDFSSEYKLATKP